MTEAVDTRVRVRVTARLSGAAMGCDEHCLHNVTEFVSRCCWCGGDYEEEGSEPRCVHGRKHLPVLPAANDVVTLIVKLAEAEEAIARIGAVTHLTKGMVDELSERRQRAIDALTERGLDILHASRVGTEVLP